MARLWDVKSGELLGSFKGHLCSLKSVAFTPEEKGNILPTQTLHLFKGKNIHCLQDKKRQFHKYKQLFLFMKKHCPVDSHYKFCLMFNSCILYWGQRWEYYGLGYQMQQKRYLFNTELEQNWDFYGYRHSQFLHSENFQTFVTSLRFLIDGYYRQVKQISGAHNKAETNPSARAKKRRSISRGMAPSVVSFFSRCPFFSPKNTTTWLKPINKHVKLAGYPAERHRSSVSGSAHPYFLRSGRRVRFHCFSLSE